MNKQTQWSTSETWQIRKPAQLGKAGMVASQHYAASEVGVDILNAGGNALDAAIATSLMIGTVEPWMSGLGGGGSLLYYDAKARQAHAVDFGMRAPWNIDPSDYPIETGQDSDLFGWPLVKDQRNVHGPLAIATPGYMAGIAAALNRFGRMPFADLIAPAVASAKHGIDVDWYATLKIATSASTLNRYEHSRKTYLPQGFPPAGEWGGPLPNMILGKLSDTLSTLQTQGPEDFYQGDIASSINNDARALDCRLQEKDLAQYQASITQSDTHQYRDNTLFTMPGVSAGPTLRDALDRLQSLWNPDQTRSPTPDATVFSAYAKALQAAYDNRLATLGDVDDRIAPSCTTHISTMDKDGNMVAMTQTLLSVFGSKVMLPGTGILMNNGMMWFDPRSGRPNSIAAGKRPLSNMCPTLLQTATNDTYALGASGGRRIMPAVFQLISFIADFNMTLDQAIHQGRIDVSAAEVISIDQALERSIADAVDEVARHTEGVECMRLTHGVYPAMFACPNVLKYAADGENSGVAFVSSPWASVVAQR